ncbi:hypothetical protein BJX96DRAFT_161988 [Aspergillus floccosus]
MRLRIRASHELRATNQLHDRNAYINGRIGNYNVVLCYMPEIGKASTASVASSLLISYPGVELALVVGICGGAPKPPNCQEIYLGDRKPGVKDTLGRPNQEIRALLNGLSAENSCSQFQSQIQLYLDSLQQTGSNWHRPQIDDSLFRASYHHKHHGHASPIRCGSSEDDMPGDICDGAIQATCDDLGCDQSQVIRCREFREAVNISAHIGTVASADTVMESGQHRDEIVRKDEVIGFEMEGAGVWDNVSYLVIKGPWQAY